MVIERQCDGCRVKSQHVKPWGYDDLDYCNQCGLKEDLAEVKRNYKTKREHVHAVYISQLRDMRSHIRDLELKVKEVDS